MSSDDTSRMDIAAASSSRRNPSNEDVFDQTTFEYPPISVEDFLALKKNELSELDLLDINKVRFVYWYGQGAKKLTRYHDNAGFFIAVENDHILFRYRIRYVISTGVYSVVVKAYDCKDKKVVAIKVFRNSFDEEAKKEYCFLEHLEKIDSRKVNYIVRIFEKFTFRQHPCIVFELLGDDLSNFILQNPLGTRISVIKSIVISILNGLNFLHENGIIHTDLKPSNILFTDNRYFNKCKVIDLGLAVYAENVRSDYSLVQARGYRAPEIFLHARYSAKIDIFSLGLITVELATGKCLFRGYDDHDYMAKYVEVFGFPPRYLLLEATNAGNFFTVTRRSVIPKVPDERELCQPEIKTLEEVMEINNQPLLIDFIKKCMDMDPRERFSADALLQHQWLNE